MTTLRERIGRRGVALVGVLAAAGLTVSGLAAPAQADNPVFVTISGTVTGPDGEGLGGVCVDLFAAGGGYVASNSSLGGTNADGSFEVYDWTGPSGSYQLRFSTDACAHGNYIPEWYDDAAERETAEVVVVPADTGVATGIDAELAAGETISGTLTDADGEPLTDANGCVSAYDMSADDILTDSVVSSTTAAADGTYTVDKLVAGEDYRLYFSSCGAGNYLGAFYEDADSLQNATPVTAQAGGVTGIDQAVPTGGRIFGTAVDDTGEPVTTPVCVEVYDAAKPGADVPVTGSAIYEHSEGAFEAYGLPTGDYKLYFRDCDRGVIGSEWYQDTWKFEYATTVHVTAGEDTIGVVAVLGPPDDEAPDTEITSGPAADSTVIGTSATFGFTSTETGSTFECRLDGAAFADCTSPFTAAGLTSGQHTLDVRSVDSAGNVDPSPASRSFTVVAVDPECAPAQAAVTSETAAIAATKATIKKVKKKKSKATSKKVRKKLKKKIAKKRAALAEHRVTLAAAQTKAATQC